MDNSKNYQKLVSTLRYLLIGSKMHLAHQALEFGLKYHVGTRKDKITPEFQHQVSQMLYAYTLTPSLMYPEPTLCTIALHDVVEDYDVSLSELERVFGKQIANSVSLLTNKQNNQKKLSQAYYLAMIDDPIASFAKGCDRIHNHQSMIGVFSKEKIKSYITETQTLILPMLKASRKKWPEQFNAYMNVTTLLKCQIEFAQSTINY